MDPSVGGTKHGLTRTGGFVPLTSVSRPLAPTPVWRGLEELSGEWAHDPSDLEFGSQPPGAIPPLPRREFLRLMSATLALAGLSGCSQPPEGIVPYVEAPEVLVPGKPLYYTTAFEHDGYGIGLLGESQMGRPVKLEGNPRHPASLGATDVFGQGSLLTLYDPDRSQAVRRSGEASTWEAFTGELSARLAQLDAKAGEGLWLLLEPTSSPTLVAQVQRLLTRFPRARVCRYSPVDRSEMIEGLHEATGARQQPVYHFDRAARILSLEADFLWEEPGSVRYARDFSKSRRVRTGPAPMSRLYVIESTPTLTGANADHRLRLRPSLMEAAARKIAAALGIGAAVGSPAEVPDEWVRAAAEDLQAHPGAGVVVVGSRQPAPVHALAYAMNQSLGALGQTVTLIPPVQPSFPGEAALAELTAAMQAELVDTLVILGANPVYTAPADLEFATALTRVPFRVHQGLYEDETARQCHWHIPESHYLEAWGDVRAFDGTATIIQPLTLPLYETRSRMELLEAFFRGEPRDGLRLVRDHWQRRFPASQTEELWETALLTGVVPEKAAATPAPVSTETPRVKAPTPAPPAETGGLELVFRPDPTVWDGRYANNAWLQELPKPLTSLTWDNAALISPATATAQSLKNGDVVELRYGGRTLTAAVWVLFGQPDGVVTLTLGYGRSQAGPVGNGTGFNAYLLRTSDAPWSGTGLTLHPTGRRYPLANAQHHFRMEGRSLVQRGTLDEFERDPRQPGFMEVKESQRGPLPSLYPNSWPSDRHAPEGYTPQGPPSAPDGAGPLVYHGDGYGGQPIPAWGMVIDLTACIGCSACTIACQAENNIATVGKDQVLMSREMHWIRVDTYHVGTPEDPERVFQPVPCMHCEKAPCEPVCPVEATSHSVEGLNEMTYNRCVGTRYCSNNCPYKVRRFNYLQYSDQQTPTIQLMRNPDVTVRSRGVMEKCTYCVQRINEARMQAEKEGRAIRDGDVVTACQQVCPTQAILFGDVNDTRSHDGHGSTIRQLKLAPHNYELLAELNTRPRTSYLARITNPNPALTPVSARPEGRQP